MSIKILNYQAFLLVLYAVGASCLWDKTSRLWRVAQVPRSFSLINLFLVINIHLLSHHD